MIFCNKTFDFFLRILLKCQKIRKLISLKKCKKTNKCFRCAPFIYLLFQRIWEFNIHLFYMTPGFEHTPALGSLKKYFLVCPIWLPLFSIFFNVIASKLLTSIQNTVPGFEPMTSALTTRPWVLARSWEVWHNHDSSSPKISKVFSRYLTIKINYYIFILQKSLHQHNVNSSFKCSNCLRQRFFIGSKKYFFKMIYYSKMFNFQIKI